MNAPPVVFSSEALEPDALRLVSLEGSEGLNQLYSHKLELVAPIAVDPRSLLHAPARVELPTAGGPLLLAGVVSEIEFEPSAAGPRYVVTLVPRLAALQERVRTRDLSGLSVLGLVRRLLEEVGLTEGSDYRFEAPLLAAEARRPRRTRARLPEPARIVQEDESDYALLSRWLEREGIGFYFEVVGGREVVVFFDGAPELPRRSGADLRVLRSIHKRLPGAVVVAARGQHALPEQSSAPVRGGRGRARVESDALWRTEAQARTLAELRREELEAWGDVLEGLIPHPGLRPGWSFAEGPRARRLVRIQHSLTQDPGHQGWSYEGRLEALLSEAPFRPLRQSGWPEARVASPAPAQPPRAEPVAPARPRAAELVGARPQELPGPGYGSSGSSSGSSGGASTSSDGDESSRAIGAGANDDRNLWAQWLSDYETVKTNGGSGLASKTTAELSSAISSVLPDGVSFADFENTCTSFEGTLGAGYEVVIGDKAEAQFGDAGAYAKGTNSIEVTDYTNVSSNNTVGTLEEVTTITSGSTAETTITGDTSETLTQTGDASETSTITGNTSETSTVTGNTSETSTVGGNVTESSTVTGNVSETSNVSGNVTETSTVGGNVTETSTVTGTLTETSTVTGVSSATSNVSVARETTIAQHLVDSTSTVTDLEFGARVLRLVAEACAVDINLLAQGASIDINVVVAKLEVMFGAWLEMRFGSGLEITCGPVYEFNIGSRWEMITADATEINLSDNTVSLTGFDKFLAKSFGLP